MGFALGPRRAGLIVNPRSGKGSGKGAALAAMLRGNDHYADVKSTVEEGFPEIQIRFDQERAGALGLTTRQVRYALTKHNISVKRL
mgnify:CR=1 FL=1